MVVSQVIDGEESNLMVISELNDIKIEAIAAAVSNNWTASSIEFIFNNFTYIIN